MEEQERREQEKPYQYWLMNIKGLGKKRKRKLLREFGSAEEIYRASEGVLRAAADGAAEKIFDRIPSMFRFHPSNLFIIYIHINFCLKLLKRLQYSYFLYNMDLWRACPTAL